MIVIRTAKVITMMKVNSLGRGRRITRVYVVNIVPRTTIPQRKSVGRTQMRHKSMTSSIGSGATMCPPDRCMGRFAEAYPVRG